jgi:hypothetical protein
MPPGRRRIRHEIISKHGIKSPARTLSGDENQKAIKQEKGKYTSAE